MLSAKVHSVGSIAFVRASSSAISYKSELSSKPAGLCRGNPGLGKGNDEFSFEASRGKFWNKLIGDMP